MRRDDSVTRINQQGSTEQRESMGISLSLLCHSNTTIKREANKYFLHDKQKCSFKNSIAESEKVRDEWGIKELGRVLMAGVRAV